ncbi:hypothetical protein T09_11089 [Trichinella sp. T9]|nr:hypothetical protein T09_11089 [Trichinella sp. T9]
MKRHGILVWNIFHRMLQGQLSCTGLHAIRLQ